MWFPGHVDSQCPCIKMKDFRWYCSPWQYILLMHLYVGRAFPSLSLPSLGFCAGGWDSDSHGQWHLQGPGWGGCRSSGPLGIFPQLSSGIWPAGLMAVASLPTPHTRAGRRNRFYWPHELVSTISHQDFPVSFKIVAGASKETGWWFQGEA